MSDTGRYKTEQEAFWAGQFGTDYIQRNQGDALIASNLVFFSRALSRTENISSCIEFGANVGMNLRALSLLKPGLDIHCIEINEDACRQLERILPPHQVFQGSILDYPTSRSFDLTLIKGVLIHVNPDALPLVYDKLHAACGRYLLIAEYYNPTPVAISYRGHTDRLFKRDFAGEILDRYRDLSLLDYGFAYRRDNNYPQDDITWFLLTRAVV